jgi:hypothetical protein
MKIAILLFVIAWSARADHWNLYCEGNETHKIEQFDPVYNDDGKLTLYPQYQSIELFNDEDGDEIIRNKGGAYYNLCTGRWLGSGGPNANCATYCQSALNLMKAIVTEIRTYDAANAKPIVTACAIPPGSSRGSIIAQEINPECSACSIREYNKKLQHQMEVCMVAYNAYAKKTSSGSNTGAGGQH